MIKCAMCGDLHRDEQMVESADDDQIAEGSIVCMGCDCRMTNAAMAAFGIDCDDLVREFDGVAL